MLDPSRLLIAVCLGLLVAAPAPAQDSPATDRLVRVSGEGTVQAPPDRATVRFGVVSRAETAEAARRQNATAAKTAMNAVREIGVAEETMRMESLRLQPRREYDPQTQTRKERGYEASRRVVVEVEDLAQLPRLVTRVVQRGANRLEGIDYALSDRTAARNDALRQAAQSARGKAQLLAESLGAALGPVRQIDEQSFGVQSPSPRAEMQLAKSRGEDAAPEPDAYAAGEIEVNATVQVTFALQ